MSLSGDQRSSSSQKAIHSPRAAAIPRLRAALTPAGCSIANHHDARIGGGRDRRGVVGRSIVDHDDLEIGDLLGENGPQRAPEERGRDCGLEPRPRRAASPSLSAINLAVVDQRVLSHRGSSLTRNDSSARSSRGGTWPHR